MLYEVITDVEMDLCGHATLAAAFCLKKLLNYNQNTFTFKTRSGDISVDVEDDLFSLKFPSRKGIPANLPDIIQQSINT